jgi:hypothetical protein
MKNTTTKRSGTVKRYFVDASGYPETIVRFTLVGDTSVYHAVTMDEDIRHTLMLTAPGDEIHFEYEVTGWTHKVNRLQKFDNPALKSELSDSVVSHLAPRAI